MMDRRTTTLATGALLAAAACYPAQTSNEDVALLRAVAIDAARWLASVEVVTLDGSAWPAAPAYPESIATNLYSGSPGVVLFFHDLYRVTGETRWRQLAVSGASYLAARLPTDDEDANAGLYTGLGGQCFVLHRVGVELGEPSLVTAAAGCFDQIVARARPLGAGVQWNEVTDIIGGSAGIGLALLWAAEATGDERYLETASAGADRLLELATETEAGLSWEMMPDYPRTMPNFSHGTAGIAYFLASVASRTGDARHADAAIRGARHLLSIADTDGDVCLIYHHEPEGEDLYYLSWCHGPAGTGRLFYRLYELTGEDEWLEWTHRSARAVMASGIPDTRTDGFWNNVGQCCGNAGVAEFFLDLYAVSDDASYLAYAQRVLEDVRERTTRDGAGARWVQAEHRVQPDNLAAQTGFMQGAAGIGMTFLRLAASLEGLPRPTSALPDSPFAGR